MPLSPQQQETLRDAINNYNFPLVYFDFETQIERQALAVQILEEHIRSQLTSNDSSTVKYGLANVLYWGYATSGYRDARVQKFMNSATNEKLTNFSELLRPDYVPTLREVKDIGFAQLSGVSFVSKVLMFLDPITHCTLDLQILKLVQVTGPKGLHSVKPSMGIPINTTNEDSYNLWRRECTSTSERYFGGGYRATDIERGYFKLVRDGSLEVAKQIYADA